MDKLNVLTTASRRYSRVKLCAQNDPDPARVLKRANDAMAKEAIDRFAVFSYFVLDAKARTVTVASAGYRPVDIYHPNEDRVERVQTEGIGLGIMEDSDYVSTQRGLRSDDVICLCSAGLVGTEDLRGDKFGNERLEAALRTAHRETMRVGDRPTIETTIS
ncbi:MAG: serine/threonine-protein phosphatase [Verrucomicrobia bacterium]|nr:serine/threonine-protein phosphatase [Verrucomicrobiota bacterium]